jgi:hypothetical protein
MADPSDETRYVEGGRVSGLQAEQRRQLDAPLSNEDLAHRIGTTEPGKGSGGCLGGFLGALLGLILGAILGAVVGFVTSPHGTMDSLVQGFVGCIIGALLGAIIGAIIGVRCGARSRALLGGAIGGIIGLFRGTRIGDSFLPIGMIIDSWIIGAFLGVITGAWCGASLVRNAQQSKTG